VVRPTRSGAVIYTRVSSKEQTDNYSLETQERTCREYAGREGLDVLRVFVESGESAKTANRVELQAMLKYVAENARTLSAVIVYKVDRLARNSTDHGNLRVQLGTCGVRLQSATENLDDSPAGRFAETTLSAIAQLDNEVRAERAKSGMTAAVSAGRFVWRAPIGYVNGPRSGPSLTPDSPVVSGLVKKAWSLSAALRQGAEPTLVPCHAQV
jgi:site-specific DNA recombinase